MATVNQIISKNSIVEADLFLGTEGIEPNQNYSLTQEEGELLLKGIAVQGSESAPALQQAFAQRKRNQERKREHS